MESLGTSLGALPSGVGVWFSSWYAISIDTGHIAQSPQSGPRWSLAFKLESVLSVSSFSIYQQWLRTKAVQKFCLNFPCLWNSLPAVLLGKPLWENKDWQFYTMGFRGGSEGKESACNAGDLGSIPGSGRSLGEGNGNPLQYSCLENPMDREAW